MYKVDVAIQGVAPLLQNRYGLEAMTQAESVKVRTGEPDWAAEWKDKMYLDGDNQLCQPGIHIESAIVKAAVNFPIKGKGKKTYKQLTQACVFVEPELILHGLELPEEPSKNQIDDDFTIDVRPVVIQRRRVLRARPRIKEGWELEFMLTVADDQLPFEVLQEILALAGRQIGIGDYRPRYGRFIVTKFKQIEAE